MAKKKEKLKDVKEVDSEEIAQTEPVKEAETVEQSPEQISNTPSKSSFGDKVKGAFKFVGNKIKGWFVNLWQNTKEKCVNAWESTRDFFVDSARTIKSWFVKNPVPEEGADGDMKTILAGSNLTRKERFFRFCRSQSGWLFVFPAVILVCIFTLYPIVNAFIRAFMQNYKPLDVRHPYDGWGFENFVRVLKGDTGTGGANFWQCLLNTFIVTIISVPLSILLALFIAVALNSIKAVQKAYQTILFLPYLTNALAMGAVFATFFDIVGTPSGGDSVGLVNNVLGLFGVSPIDWLEPHSHSWGTGDVQFYWASYIAAIVYDVWAGLPFKILILFSSLQSVNKQYYDAAKIDGASKSKILWKITAPMISPMLSYLFITGVMGGMKAYTSIVGLFGEDMGMDYAMGTVVGYIYQYTDKGEMGFAFAGSLLLFIIIMIITAISNRVSKKRVTYT